VIRESLSESFFCHPRLSEVQGPQVQAPRVPKIRKTESSLFQIDDPAFTPLLKPKYIDPDPALMLRRRGDSLEAFLCTARVYWQGDLFHGV
jgi:hypothetical protein